MKFSDLLTLAKKARNVYIMGHVNPDGDCIGACIGLASMLEKSKVNAKVLLKDIPNMYNFLPISQYVSDILPKSIDLLIALDCGDINRFGEFYEVIDRVNTIVNIDHHVSNTHFGQYNYVDEKASSTCEILFDRLDDKTLIDETIAKALYTGIIYDTGVFKHSNTTKRTHDIAGELIDYSFDFTEIINKLFYYKSMIGLKIQSIAINNIQLFNDDKIAVTFITKEEAEAAKAEKNHTEGIVQLLNEINTVQCAIFIYESESNAFKISLRSKGSIDVCEVAKAFGGGGHIKASGCTINGVLDDIIQNIVSKVLEQK